MDKDASQHYPFFTVIGNNSKNTGECNATPNLYHDSSTSSSSMSHVEAEIYVGDMFEKDSKVYEVKKVDHKNGQVTCAMKMMQKSVSSFIIRMSRWNLFLYGSRCSGSSSPHLSSIKICCPSLQAKHEFLVDRCANDDLAGSHVIFLSNFDRKPHPLHNMDHSIVPIERS